MTDSIPSQYDGSARPDRILRRPEVETLVGLRRSAIYKAIRDGRFPPPVRISSQAVGWFESDITAWIKSRRRRGKKGG